MTQPLPAARGIFQSRRTIGAASRFRTTTSFSSRAGPASSKTITVRRKADRLRWTSSWPRTAARVNYSLFRRGPKRSSPGRTRDAIETLPTEIARLNSRFRGRSVGTKIAGGAVRVIADPKHLDDFQQGEILVADKTDPDWEPIMKKAAAIVTNRGGRTCHAAIVSRELGLPAIVGTEHGTELLAQRTDRHRLVRGRRHRFRLRRQTAVRSGADEPQRPAAAAHQSDDERGQSGRGISPFLHSK